MNALFLKIQSLIKIHYSYFLPYFLFLIIGAPLLFIYQKGDILLWLNSVHTPFLDFLFSYGTWLGDGLFIAAIIIPFAFIKVRYGLNILIIYLITGGFVQILKFFFGLPRPMAFFPKTVHLYMIEGIKIYSSNSFPSGHTATGFALFLYLSYITRNKWLGAIFFLLALLVGFSRIYLLQHFFIDVYFGSIVGVVLTLFIIVALENQKKLNSVSWYNNPLFNAFKRNQELK